MKLGLISSAWLGSPVGTAEGIRQTKAIGFDTIDIFADPLEIDIKERRLIKDTCIECGLPVVSTVCCALGIADFNGTVRRFHVDRAKRYLDLGYELNGKNLLLVVGEYIWQQEVIAPKDQWAWAVEGVRELGVHAASLGLEIAIELEPFTLSLVNDLPKMVAFLDDVNHPAVKANLDISHEEMSRLAGTLTRLADRTPPPSVGGKRFRIYYCTQTGNRPFRIRLFCNQERRLTESYRRYLEAGVIEEFGLDGCPMLFELVGKKPRIAPGAAVSHPWDEE